MCFKDCKKKQKNFKMLRQYPLKFFIKKMSNFAPNVTRKLLVFRNNAQNVSHNKQVLVTSVNSVGTI